MIFRLNINWHNLFWYFQSKIPLPISKGNPDSDDESIMRKVRTLDVDVNDETGLINVLESWYYVWYFSKWFISYQKGGDSDDETESVGSGFTSIAPSTLKASTSMLPPTSTPIPKERLLRDLQVTTHDDHDSKTQKVGKHEVF